MNLLPTPIIPTPDLISQKFIEPLSDSTKRLFLPISFAHNDKLHISLDEEGKRFLFKFYALTSDGREVTSSWIYKRFIQRIPERKLVAGFGSVQFLVACTDFTAILTNALWDKDRLSFEDDAKIVFDYLLIRFMKQTFNSEIKAKYKLHKIVPEMPDDWIDHPKRPLMDSQKVALASSLYEDGANHWGEQGTGKTPVIISRVCYEAHRIYKKEKRMYRALIVVPKCVRMSWHNKFMDFAVHPGKLTVLRGDQLDRVKLMCEAFKPDDDCEYTVVICSYGTIQQSWEAIRMVEWDHCSLDEAHMIKSDKTKRWKRILELREICKSRSGLTGTPIANSLFDAWTQLEWLGEGLSGFTSYKAFRSYYGKFLPADENHREILNGYNNLPIIQERFARLCFMITRKEAMPELPGKTYDIYEVEMSKFQRECYINLQKKLAIEIEADMERSTNQQLTAKNILTKLLRLSQITSGYIKWDTVIDDDGNSTGGSIEDIFPNPKIDAVIEILKSKTKFDKTIIWTNWVHVIKMLSKRLDEEGIKHVTFFGGTSDRDRDEAQRQYNEDPNCKVFLGNPAAGGVGLDLWGHIPEWVGTTKDHGCNTTQEIYVSQSWSMIHRTQSEDRGVRWGTRVSVLITDLIFPGTIDEEIACRVVDKKINAVKLQDVTNIMQKILSYVPRTGEENA